MGLRIRYRLAHMATGWISVWYSCLRTSRTRLYLQTVSVVSRRERRTFSGEQDLTADGARAYGRWLFPAEAYVPAEPTQRAFAVAALLLGVWGRRR